MALDAKTHPRYATEACWWYLEGCGLRKWLTLWVTVVEEWFFVFAFCWSVIVNFPRLNMLCFVVSLLYIPGGSMLKIHLPVQETRETRVWSLGREDPLRRKWQSLQVCLSGESHGQRSLAGYSPWGFKHTCNQINQSLYIHFFSERMPLSLDLSSCTLGRNHLYS